MSQHFFKNDTPRGWTCFLTCEWQQNKMRGKNSPVAPHGYRALFEAFYALPRVSSGETTILSLEEEKQRRASTKTGRSTAMSAQTTMIRHAAPATPPDGFHWSLKAQRLSSLWVRCHSFLSRTGWRLAKEMSRLLPETTAVFLTESLRRQ